MSREKIERAVSYPYRPHHEDYLFHNGKVRCLAPDVDLKALTPVLAVGSNRSPEQLARKFADMEVSIPVTWVTARDVDVVHAARMAGYGAIPATLARSEGTEVELWITWLDGPALAEMDETEGFNIVYDRVCIPPKTVEHPHVACREVQSYAARCGCLAFDAAPVALAAIPATRRRFAAMRQREVLERLHAEHGDGAVFETWLLNHICDAGKHRRAELTRSLARSAIRDIGDVR